MAVSYESIASATSDDSSTITVTKPTGLATGDLMVAFIASSEDASTNSSATGWTVVDGIADSTFFGSNLANHTCLAKIATSGDAAASNFTFTLGGGNDGAMASIVRLSSNAGGFDVSSLIVSDSALNSGTTATVAGGLTPAGANTMLIGSFASGASGSFSAWAVATDDPTWTEIKDATYTWTSTFTHGIAYAARTEATGTGDFTATAGNSEHLGILIAVNDKTDITVSPSVLTATFSVQAPVITADANVSPSVLTATFSVQSPTITTTTITWTNEALPSTSTWTDETKE